MQIFGYQLKFTKVCTWLVKIIGRVCRKSFVRSLFFSCQRGIRLGVTIAIAPLLFSDPRQIERKRERKRRPESYRSLSLFLSLVTPDDLSTGLKEKHQPDQVVGQRHWFCDMRSSSCLLSRDARRINSAPRGVAFRFGADSEMHIGMKRGGERLGGDKGDLKSRLTARYRLQCSNMFAMFEMHLDISYGYFCADYTHTHTHNVWIS